MTDVNVLPKDHRVFLAGTIKHMVLADGIIEAEEILNLDKINAKLHFDDFDERLEEFEITIQDAETYWDKAREIEHTDTQDAVLQVLYELGINHGVMTDSEEHLFQKLKRTWNR